MSHLKVIFEPPLQLKLESFSLSREFNNIYVNKNIFLCYLHSKIFWQGIQLSPHCHKVANKRSHYYNSIIRKNL